MNIKFKDDSLLIYQKNGPIINEYYTLFNTLSGDFKTLFQYQSSLDIEFCKYKKSIKSKFNIDEVRKQKIEDFKNTFKNYHSNLKSYKKQFKQFSKLSKAQIEKTKEENHFYLKEQFIEYQMNVIRSSFINRHYKVRVSENKILKSKCSKLSKKIEKDKVKLKVK
jgi:hypothetical protein